MTDGISPPRTDLIDGGYGALLITLTDEELHLIDPVPADARLVVSPFLDQLDTPALETAVVIAARGLVARGLVTPPDVRMSDGTDDVPVSIEVNELVAGLLLARRSAPTVVCAKRTLAERADYCYWYVLDDESAIEEFVEPTGLHRFRALETHLVGLALYGYVNPERVGGRDGATTVVDAGAAAAGQTPAAVLERLGTAHSITEVLVRSGSDPPEEPLLLGVAAGPDGLSLAEVVFGRLDAIRIRSVSGATLLARIGEQLP